MSSKSSSKPQSGAVGAAASSQTLPKLTKAHFEREMLKFLEDIGPRGTFACAGYVEAPDGTFPSICVKGVGDLRHPLSSSQAAALIASSTLAPYGKGAATLTDTSVRKAQQVDPGDVTIGTAWDKQLAHIVETACSKLGVKGTVSAHMHKMLIYEKGGHFVAHQDTEKDVGMFGTLIIQLPAGHKGGALTVKHGRETFVHQFGGDHSKDSRDYVWIPTHARV
jgi:hypothetical protein